MKKINFKFLFIFVAIFGLLVFLHNTKIIAPVETALQFVLNPIGARLQSFSGRINLFYLRQTDKSDLFARLEEVEDRVSVLTVENALLRKAEEENIKLRQHLNFFNDRQDLNKVLANVVARESLSAEGGAGDFIIDKGLRDGVLEGLVVLDEKGAVVGKVVAVESASSRLKLSTSPGCRLAAAILRGERTVGLSSGNMGLTIDLDFVPQTAQISAGDIVVTSGLEPNIPAGLAIGRVILIEKGTNEIWQKVSAEPVVDFDRIFIVSVILP